VLGILGRTVKGLLEQFKTFKALGSIGKLLNRLALQFSVVSVLGNVGKLLNWLFVQSKLNKELGKLGIVVIKLLIQLNDVSDVKPLMPDKSVIISPLTSKVVRVAAGGRSTFDALMHVGQTLRIASAKLASGMVCAGA
jgi:hypothetical protein